MEEEKVFDLVLVDIKEVSTTGNRVIKCTKKNMYDPNLKYIAISYRWGELKEQLVETPDYTAHITSFDLFHLILLCSFIKKEPKLKEMDYLWVDAISVDQQNKEGKKETILKMNQIYKKASYILAVPDLHLTYLLKHPENSEISNLIYFKYKKTIYEEIFNSKLLSTDDTINNVTKSSIINPIQHRYTHNDDEQYLSLQPLTNETFIKKMKALEIEIEALKIEIKENKSKQEKDETKRIYRYLAYLIGDWSNRAWVISEYHIAKQKYKQHGTPLMYIFISFFNYDLHQQPFFSYHFNDDDDDDDEKNEILSCENVNNAKTFHQFLKTRFMQRSHLEMILSSNATRNEDRFNAILPSWNKYKHLIKNVSEWDTTDMTSVRLKLYEIMNDDDLWEKAKLLHACSDDCPEIIIPSFANHNNVKKLMIIEKYDDDHVDYKEFERNILDSITYSKTQEEVALLQQCMNEYKSKSKSLWIENLISIQFNQYRCFLSVKANSYFIKNEEFYDHDRNNYIKNKLSLDDGHDEIQEVFLPFFTFALPDYVDSPHIYTKCSNVYLVGNRDKNRWILSYGISYGYQPEDFCSKGYTFNIY
ncbi:unnamed protein product [Cunninghamella blakesleeana]